jgi:hypothetical protein
MMGWVEEIQGPPPECHYCAHPGHHGRGCESLRHVAGLGDYPCACRCCRCDECRYRGLAKRRSGKC